MTAASVPELPRVSRVLPLGGMSVRLELDSGEVFELAKGVRAALNGFPDAQGLYTLLYEWGRPREAACLVPAELLPELLSYFPEGQP